MQMSWIDDPALSMKVAEMSDRVEQYQIQKICYDLENIQKNTKELADQLDEVKKSETDKVVFIVSISIDIFINSNQYYYAGYKIKLAASFLKIFYKLLFTLLFFCNFSNKIDYFKAFARNIT